MIAGCPTLECLLLNKIRGFNSIRINSRSLICIGFCYFGVSPSKKLIIEDTPLLERLLQLKTCVGLHVSLISAPRLETLVCLTDCDLHSELVFGSTVIRNLRAVSLTEEMCSVKVLAVDVISPRSMDTVFDLLRCFPCLEKLYIQLSREIGGRCVWRRKHLDQIKCLDTNLETVVLKDYKGTKSQVKFATLFVLNVKRLEVMRFEAGGLEYSKKKKFVAEQRRLDQLFERRASRAALFSFTASKCHKDITHIKRSHDLSKANPFECTC